jgi:diguanylate cyclase (GGDEF)-like protein
MRRPRLGPVTQIALALAVMACVLVLIAHAVFRVYGDGRDERDRARRLVAEGLAVQVAKGVHRGDLDEVRALLEAIAGRDPQIGSILLRRAQGALIAQVGDPARWGGELGPDGRSTRDRLKVPLFSGSALWGELEIGYRRDESVLPAGWASDPLVPMLGFVFVAGAIGFGLFIRRVLQHLDPSSAIPDRVRTAFDSLFEGIVILDAQGRIVLTNQAFRHLRADADVRDGRPLADLGGWQPAEGAATDANALPWAQATRDARTVAGVSMRVGHGAGSRDVVVTCSPIRDGREAVRGCMVSFADVTEVARANARLRRALDDLERSRAQVEATNRALHRAATRDPLTDCLNRRAFAESATPILHASRVPGGPPAAALLLDIDHFKSVNDRFGHAVGDQVIRAVGETLGAGLRGQDLVSRHGGEEFAVLLPGCDARAASAIADTLRRRIAEHCRQTLGQSLPDLSVTVSIGVSDTRLGGQTLDALLDEADTALYRAKRGGRNRVVVHDPAAASLETTG